MPHPLYSPVRRDSPLGCLGRALLVPALLVGLAVPRSAVAQSGSALALTAPSAPAGRLGDLRASPDLALVRILASSDLALLNRACLQAARADQGAFLRALRLRLLAVKPAPQPLAVVLANAEALVNCRAPDDALNVLNRYGPAPGRERTLWLWAQWRAADAGLHHRLAEEALLRLAGGANAERPSERFLRLSRRIDDAYGEWQVGRQALGRQDPLGLARQQQLEQQLRSPRQSGGHAASRP